MVQSLQNQFLDFDSCLFRLVQERWHHLRHISQISLLSSLKMHLWQARDVHPLFPFFMEIFQCCLPSSLTKIYLYAMNINVFITNCMWYRLKTKQVINWQKSWTIISSNNINLVCEAYSSMTPSFSNGLSFEKGLGLLITPLCFFCLQQADNCGFLLPSVFLSFSFLETW